MIILNSALNFVVYLYCLAFLNQITIACNELRVNHLNLLKTLGVFVIKLAIIGCQTLLSMSVAFADLADQAAFAVWDLV